MGSFSETDKGHGYVLCIGDLFSKYCVAVPLRDITAITVTEAVIANWVAYFGVPLELHSDKGSNYESEIFKGVCKVLGKEKTRTTTMNPQSNGFIEHINHTLCDFLNCVIQDSPFNWDLLIKLCMLAYNSAVQESTKETPNTMMFGQNPTLPIDLIMPVLSKEKYINAHDYVLQVQERLYHIHTQAREHLKNAALKQSKQYNNRLKINIYEIGSHVWYFHPNLAKKVKENFLKWQGPYVVKEVLSDTLYRISKVEGPSDPIVVHHNKLKPVLVRELQGEVGQDNMECRYPPRQRNEPNRLGEWLTKF
jgi:hypothetical protein